MAMKKNTGLKKNAMHLEKEIVWLESVVEQRMTTFMSKKSNPAEIRLAAPAFRSPVSVYQQFIRSFDLKAEERIILLLSLMPYIAPTLIERVLEKLNIDSKLVPELGGIRGSFHGGLLPTGQTALFILAGDSLEKRMECSLYFSPKHKFYSKNILRLEDTGAYEPELSAVITISKDVLSMLTTATAYQPLFNTSFPARLLTTEYSYDDMVLPEETDAHLREIKTWLDTKKKLLGEWGFDKKIAGGYKCLFYGPPGTGKSLAAALIGKQNDLPVYRVDLSMVISKYIGETEKNLSTIFNVAANKKWILFFDEADALFGKRTSNTQSSNDRFANQEVSYLLMRMEEYEGVAILATNLKGNIDKAFIRRFQQVVHFPVPDTGERKKLWVQSFSKKTTLAKDVDLDSIAANFALTGSNIMNVVRFASMLAMKEGSTIITKNFLMAGIKRELSKETTLSGDS